MPIYEKYIENCSHFGSSQSLSSWKCKRTRNVVWLSTGSDREEPIFVAIKTRGAGHARLEAWPAGFVREFCIERAKDR